MLLLALETTSAHGSLALACDGCILGERALNPGHYSTELLDALVELADGTQSALAAVDAFAVATGPGSFTGVRIGLTTVKGLIEVWRRPAVAVSTLAAVAAADSLDAPRLAALNASRGEVYWGSYPDGVRAWTLGAAAGEEGVEGLAAFAARAAASAAPCCLPRGHEALASALGITQPHWVSPLLATGVARLGAALLAHGRTLDALTLDANYIRRSDAELYSLPGLAAQLRRG